jgi:hypothetical protein
MLPQCTNTRSTTLSRDGPIEAWRQGRQTRVVRQGAGVKSVNHRADTIALLVDAVFSISER